ncbi:hypothetical protein T646_02645 [Staphylococcus aureus MRSN 8611]|nr:hypothetical protein T646_02645 [Staphylococcus aureus MRSN 8611]
MCKLGWDNDKVIGAPTQRLAESQLTIVCKLGWSPDTEKLAPQFLQTMQVGGAPTQKLAESQLTIMCKLAGPQHRSWRKVRLQ